jgi:PAS domain S-box-containing protein
LRAEPLSVLVVDDDSQMLRTTSDILTMSGYKPIPAATGHEALEFASTTLTAPSIALVDLHLPDMDGIDLVARLRAISPITEVVILTGNGTMESAVFALRERSYDYLIKPVQPDYLMATIDRAAERSERRRAEAARQASEERLQLIFDHVSDALFVADTSGCILDANPAACELTQLSIDQLRSAQLEEILPESEAAVSAAYGSAPESTRGAVRQPACERACGVKESRVLDVQAAVFAPGVLVYTIRDLTKQRHLEEQLAQSQKMEAVGQLAGGVAHDFNNLLTVIMSYSAMLLQDLAPDDPQRADIQEIADAAARGSGLTRQLLAFSRKQVLQLRPVSVNDVVADIEKILRRLIGDDVELATTLDPAVSLISSDPGQMEQVLINLAVNARDAMPDGGRLHISTGEVTVPDDDGSDGIDVEPGVYVAIAVRDTGTGMTRDVQQHVFEPFFTTKEPGKGTGLGLPTVYGIAKQAGGTVVIESEPGEGTAVTVYFPRMDDSAVAVPEHPGTHAPLAGDETVLLVEDDASLRALAARALRINGYEVLMAANGAEALKVAASHPGPVDIVASDVVMPGIGGRQLIEQLVETYAGIKVLFMSGYTNDEIVRRGVLGGGTAFLQKPFTPDQLVRSIRAVLDRPASLRHAEALPV